MRKENMFLNSWLKMFHPHPPLWIRPRLGKVAWPEFARTLKVVMRYPDAIFIEHNKINIVEAKLDPSGEAVGQLLLYGMLFRETEEFRPWWNLPIRLIFLTTRVDKNLIGLCKQEGIFYIAWYPEQKLESWANIGKEF